MKIETKNRIQIVQQIAQFFILKLHQSKDMLYFVIFLHIRRILNNKDTIKPTFLVK